MGFLSDLYVSTPELAPGYDDGLAIPDNERAQLKGLTFLEFSTLWAIIEGEPWDGARMEAFENVMTSEDGEKVIFRLPEALVAVASELDEPRAAAAAEEWAQTEELSCRAADVRPAIDELRRLSLVAQQSGKSVYLWNCL